MLLRDLQANILLVIRVRVASPPCPTQADLVGIVICAANGESRLVTFRLFAIYTHNLHIRRHDVLSSSSGSGSAGVYTCHALAAARFVPYNTRPLHP